MKKILILAFSISFMAFIFEPIMMYANNINDFWFDFMILIFPTMLFFIVSFVLIFGILLLSFYIAKSKKKEKVFYIFLFSLGALFLVFYINSNYLAGFLPALDGEIIDYGGFLVNFFAILIPILIVVGIILLVKKFRFEKAAKILAYIQLAVVVMLSVSLISVFLTTPVLENKRNLIVSTTKNLNLASEKENFFIFLVDAIDSTTFNKIVESDEKYQETLKDFVYFPDSLSGYDFTRDSIPLIFSGVFNKNEQAFSEYSTKAFDGSPLFKALDEQNYLRNFYDNDFVWESEEVTKFSNIESLENKVKLVPMFKQEMKYILFKFLPQPLKRFSKIEGLNFNLARPIDEREVFRWGDVHFYNDVLEEEIGKTDKKVFSYIHIEGAHVPFTIDENVRYVDEGEGSYPKKVEATMKIIRKYLERLKSADVYDNSSIVILADHGYNFEESGRQNPILYIKTKNETRESTKVSEKQVSYVDLAEAFVRILNRKTSEELFADLPVEGRTRTFIHNGFKTEDHMIEYQTTDKAWNKDSLIPTGREFNL